MARRIIISTFVFTIVMIGGFFSPVFAEPIDEEVVISTYFDAETIVKGYTLESHNGMMRLGIRPATLNVDTQVDVKTLPPELMAATYPEGKELLGNVYLFDILNKDSYDGSDFFFLEIKYETPEGELATLPSYKRIYFYNAVSDAWEELPSMDYPSLNSVRALIHLPYARLAVFSDPVMSSGKASWYRYQECNCAASPDYPKGTYLVVSAVNSDKTVTVQVNDYGPDREIHPDRVIDLDAVAFEKLAPLGAGIIDVVVRLLQ